MKNRYMNEDNSVAEERILQDSLAIQDACNLSGVLMSFAAMIQAMREVKGKNWEWVDKHPVSRIMANKVCHLAGSSEFSESGEEYSKIDRAIGLAIDHVLDLSAAYDLLYNGHCRLGETQLLRLSGETEVTFHIPNLDAIDDIDELMDLWMQYSTMPKQKAVELSGDPAVVNDLANYAANKATAMRCRERGDVGAALTYEGICEKIYADLPHDYRW